MAESKNKILVILCDGDREIKRYVGNSRGIVEKFVEQIGGTMAKHTVSHPKSNYIYTKTIPSMNQLAADIGSPLRMKKIPRSRYYAKITRGV